MSARDRRQANEAAIVTPSLREEYASLADGRLKSSQSGIRCTRACGRARKEVSPIVVGERSPIPLGVNPSSGRSHGVHQQRGGSVAGLSIRRQSGS